MSPVFSLFIHSVQLVHGVDGELTRISISSRYDRESDAHDGGGSSIGRQNPKTSYRDRAIGDTKVDGSHACTHRANLSSSAPEDTGTQSPDKSVCEGVAVVRITERLSKEVRLRLRQHNECFLRFGAFNTA